MQSSITRVIPFILGFSPRQPVSVCGTGTSAQLSRFSRQREFTAFPTLFRSASRPGLVCRYFTYTQPQRLPALIHQRGTAILLCPCFVICPRWYRNVYRLCIIYAFRPQLSSRLTLGGRTFPRKPLTFDGGVSHSACATYAGILSCMQSTAPFDTASARIHCSSTDVLAYIPKLRCQVLAPVIFGASSLDQ